jgi:hypothetical protein
VNVLISAPISYEVASGGTTHAPMIVAQIGGVEARLIVDTGSDVHLLNEEFADALDLTKVPGEEGTDHSGATMPSWNVGDVPMRLGQVALNLRNVVSIPAPPPFPGFGIRGILSPEHLHPHAFSVIDLVNDELLLLEGTDEEAADFLHARSPALSLLTLPRDAGFEGVVVEASIEGFEAIPSMLNTGGKATEFSTSAVPGLAVKVSERLGGGVGGSGYQGGFVGRQTLVVDGRRLPVPALAVRERMHDPQGLIGMDVLRGTVLAVAADLSRPVLWQIPDRA